MEDLQEITSAFFTKTDAIYKLHVTLGHLPYSRIERMILKGIMKRYTIDVNLIKKKKEEKEEKRNLSKKRKNDEGQV